MQVKEAMLHGTAVLETHRCKITLHSREAEDILAWAIGASREALYAHPERRLTAPQRRRYDNALKRRVRHEPVEYVTGNAGFMGRDFRVTPATLIPRWATETLLEEAILFARRHDDVTFIDVGTGSGAIAITLAATFPKSHVLATDLSAPALIVARANAKRLGVTDRVAFVKADLLPNPLPRRGGATVIVANLPYIPASGMRKLAPEIRLYEPRSALAGGKDGLVPSKRLINRLAAARLDGATGVLFELLPGQCSRMEAYARKSLPGWSAKRIANDGGIAIGVMFSSPQH